MSYLKPLFANCEKNQDVIVNSVYVLYKNQEPVVIVRFVEISKNYIEFTTDYIDSNIDWKDIVRFH